MRDVEAAEVQQTEDAKVAVEIFVDRVQKPLDNMLLLHERCGRYHVFTAGIGENSIIRARIIRRLDSVADIDP